MSNQIIHCVACNKAVLPRLTSGKEIYPHRPDLYSLPFWTCDDCGNFVGCHHRSKNRTKPLGCIPTPAIRQARKKIHSALDPLWRDGHMKRKDVYKLLSERLGYDYHTAEVRSVDEINKVVLILDHIKSELGLDLPF